MEYRIEKLDFEFEIVGVRQRVITKKAFETVPLLWQKANQDGLLQRLIDMSWENPKCKVEGILGVCGTEAFITDVEFDYFIR